MIDPRNLSRRDVLRMTGGAGAALLAGWQPFDAAAATDKPKFTCALVSDNHLRRRGDVECQYLQRTVEQINQSPAEFSLFCGDLVEKGQLDTQQKYYAEWLDITKNLKRPYRAVPGNHDPNAVFLKHVHKETDFILDHQNFRFICFSNAEPNGQTDRQYDHQGVVTPEQITWLRDRLGEAAKKNLTVILFAHVIFHANRHPDVGWYIKKGREEFDKLLKDHRHIAAFFAGHFHVGVRGWDDTHGVHEIILPSTANNADRKLKEGFSLNEFRVGFVYLDAFDDKLVLKYKPLDAKDCTAMKELPLKKR